MFATDRLNLGSIKTLRRCQVICLTLSSIGILTLIERPTVDFDEGFFFQSAIHATQTGVPGFPWSDWYFGRVIPYIPLNSLDPLINCLIAYLPREWWLIAGRAVSAASVIVGISLLFFCGSRRATARPIDYVMTAFVAFCLPLWLHARMIRPEAIAFLLCCAGSTAAARTDSKAVFVAGLLGGLCVLAHTIQGLLVSCLLGALCLAKAPAERGRWKTLALVVAGSLVPLAVFYGSYVRLTGFQILRQQIGLFLALTPRNVQTFLPTEHFRVWLSHLRGQVNLVPLLGLVTLSAFASMGSAGANKNTARVHRIAILLFMLFWVFIYPRKALSPVILLLPLSWTVLTSLESPARSRLMLYGISTVFILDAMLLVRNEWRLSHVASGASEITSTVRIMESEALLRPSSRLLAKPWLVFAVPADVTIWDITVAPVLLKDNGNGPHLDNMMNNTDAALLEWSGGKWIDEQQQAIADYCQARSWREFRVQTTRYFQPIELVLFVSPNYRRPL